MPLRVSIKSTPEHNRFVRALAGMATSVTINDPATKATEAASGGFKPTPQETFEVDSKRDAVLSAPPVPDEKEKMAPGGDQPTHVPETKPQPVGRRRIVSFLAMPLASLLSVRD